MRAGTGYRICAAGARALLFLAALLACVGPAPGAAPSAATAPDAAELGRLPFRHYPAQEYGQHAQNWAVAQDPRGVVYIGNNVGVLEYDGVAWRTIYTEGRTGVRSLGVDEDGRVHVGAQGEFGYLQADARGELGFVSLLPLVPEDARGFTDVWYTLPTARGVFYLAASHLFLYDGVSVRVWRAETGFHRAFLLGGELLLREVGKGLMRLNGDVLELVPGGEVFAERRIETLVPWAPGEGLLCTRDAGCSRLVAGALLPWPNAVDTRLGQAMLYTAWPTRDGGVALGTLLDGVYLLDREGRLRAHLGKATGFPSDTIYALQQDRQGGLWLATENGLVRVEIESPLSHFDEARGLTGSVFGLQRFRGDLYAATHLGLERLRNGRFEPIEGIAGQTWQMLDLGDQLLIANIAGVYAWDGERLDLVRPSSQPSNSLLRWPGDANRVLVGLVDGLASIRREGGHWIDEGSVPDLPEHARMLLADRDGSIWIGTQAQGVLRARFPPEWTGGASAEVKVERFGLEHGLPTMNNNNIYAVGGEVLVGSFAGLLRFDAAQAKWIPHPDFAQLVPGGPFLVNPLVELPDGRIVLDAGPLGGRGLALPSPQGGFRWDAAPLRPLHGRSAFVLHADSDGIVWLGGAEGLVRFESAPTELPGDPPRALVRRVVTPDGEQVFAGAGLPVTPRLPWRRDALRFEFAAPALDGVDRNRYQTRLDGLDPDWSALSREVYRDYTNLGAGTYRFRVRVEDVYGRVGSEGSFEFVLPPPPWLSAWAYALYVLAGLAMLWALLQWRTRRVVRENAALEALVAERTRELVAKNREVEASSQRADAIFKALNDALVGETIDGHYRIEAMLGAGGFGTVYRATQIELERTVAVKVLRPAAGQDREQALARFRSEGLAAVTLRHPNIVAVYDFAIWHEAVAYLVMEYVEGLTLEAAMQGTSRFAPGQTVAILAPVCDALAAAHAACLVHRDVKPANILLELRDGEQVPRLIDFGIARLQQAAQVQGRTATGIVLGTPEYIAPERALEQDYDGRADVYAVGVIAYEMLAGAPPFARGASGDVPSWLRRITQEDARPLQQACGDIPLPTTLCDLVMRCLARDPVQRPTAAELAAALRGVCPGAAPAGMQQARADTTTPSWELPTQALNPRAGSDRSGPDADARD